MLFFNQGIFVNLKVSMLFLIKGIIAKYKFHSKCTNLHFDFNDFEKLCEHLFVSLVNELIGHEF